jgi:AcrR family transcriptional regulator
LASETVEVAPSPDRAAVARGRRNQLGQIMGPKGIQTRRRLLDATAALLDSAPLRDLTVAQIIRASGVSAGTFYVYFPEVSDAVLAVIGEVTQSPPGLLVLFDDPWPMSVAFERSHELVATYVENVQRYAALFRVRNLASDEGDARFSRLRLIGAMPLIGAIAGCIERRQASAEAPRELNATHAAGALVAMMERIAVLRLPPAREKVTRSTLMHVAAYLAERLLAEGAPSDQRWTARIERQDLAVPAAGGDPRPLADEAFAGARGRRYHPGGRDRDFDLLPLLRGRIGIGPGCHSLSLTPARRHRGAIQGGRRRGIGRCSG